MIHVAAALLVLQGAAARAEDFGIEAWQACIIQHRDELRDADEPVETIATAILGSCQSEASAAEGRIAKAMSFVDNPRERQRLAREQVADTRRVFHDSLVAYLVEYRMSAN